MVPALPVFESFAATDLILMTSETKWRRHPLNDAQRVASGPPPVRFPQLVVRWLLDVRFRTQPLSWLEDLSA